MSSSDWLHKIRQSAAEGSAALGRGAGALLAPVTSPRGYDQEATFVSLQRQSQLRLALEYRRLDEAARRSLRFEDVAFDVWSSTGEDGILLYIFSLIGMGDRRAVDIGAGGVQGSNVANLIVHHDFGGLLVDGNPRSLADAEAFYLSHRHVALFPPSFRAARIDADNANALIAGAGLRGEIDLLCIDIDGIDYWIWKAIDVVTPRVVVVEYQDILGPERAWTVPYDPGFDVDAHPVNRERYNYCGASLAAFAKLGAEKGYRLVGCSRGGWNAFFVRRGVGDEVLPEVDVASCFRHPWNRHGMEHRFPLVANLPWQEV